MFEILQTINTGKENPILTYEQPLECGDKNAHTWIVRVYDKNDMPVDLTGMNVIAYFSPREIEKSFSVRGSVQSNVAKVILDEKCYATPGRLTGVFQVSNVDDIVSMAIAKFRVIADINDQIVDTGDPIDDVQDLLAQIEAMKSATKAATDAAYQANLSTEAANAAAEAANAAAGTAGLAANAANNSASLANSAASNADEAAKRANTAAETIETATGAADEAAEAANQAADRANAAAAVVDENLEKVELNISEAGNVQIAAIQAAGAAQQSAIENKAANALASIPEDYTALNKTVKSLKDFKADCIVDQSAKAAYHELHAQDGPMSVTLHGKTTETGTGDKSPENPYVISGAADGAVKVCGKNLFKPEAKVSNSYGVKMTVNEEAGNITFVGTSTTAAGRTYLRTKPFYLAPGRYTASMITAATDIPIMFAQYTKGTASIANSGGAKTLMFTVTKHEPIDIGFNLKNGVVYDIEMKIQIEAGETATDFESFNGNVINLPLLPDGAPLYGNGTVDDIVENDVPSGCDRKITFAEGDDLTLANFDAAANVVYSDTTAEIVVTNGAITSTLTYPCTVFYRSADYTPDKDIRVTKVTRRFKRVEFNHFANVSKDWSYFTINGHSSLRKLERTTVGEAHCNWLIPYRGSHSSSKVNSIQVGDKSGYIRIYNTTFADETALNAFVAENPLVYVGKLITPEVYMTDKRELRKPYGIMPVTVTGSGETEVTYPHDTKHYIDSKISELVTLALSNQ